MKILILIYTFYTYKHDIPLSNMTAVAANAATVMFGRYSGFATLLNARSVGL